MPVSGITSSTAAATRQTVKQDAAGISGQDFMNILIKQLQMQDPFEPMTNQEMIAQMSTIRELEMNTRLTERLEKLTEQQRFTSAAGLIGKLVRGAVTDSAGNEFELRGQVLGVEFTTSGDAILELSTGQRLPISGLREVIDMPAIPTGEDEPAQDESSDQSGDQQPAAGE